jgi:hypothetical protein
MSHREKTVKDLEDILARSRTTVLRNDFLAGIGRVVANFALLENELFLLIRFLLGVDTNIAGIVTSEMSFRNLLDLSTSLIKEKHGGDEAKQCAEVLKIASEAEEIRNRLIHSVWGVWGSGGAIVIRTKHTAKRGKGLNFQREEFTLDDISAFAVNISRAIRAVEIYTNHPGAKSGV